MEELLKELDEIKQKMAKIGKKIVEIEKKIEEEEKNEKNEKNERWKPQKGDIYWFISDVGCICNSKWDNDYIDRERYLTSNYYRTKEECEFTKEKLKVIAELKEFEEPKYREWDGDICHYFIYYNILSGEVDIGAMYITKRNDIYFKSKEKALQAINTIGKDKIKKYYLEIEE